MLRCFIVTEQVLSNRTMYANESKVRFLLPVRKFGHLYGEGDNANNMTIIGNF